MYTFLIYANRQPTPVTPLLDKACAITKSLMPSIGEETAAYRRNLPEINGGWFYLRPARETQKHLIDEFTDQEFSILVFGEIYGVKGKRPALHLRNTLHEGGIDSLRSVDGCFSAVIVTAKHHTIHVISDLIGRRTLRFFNANDYFLISTHDVPILATGLCPFEVDHTSTASISAFGWSLQGKALCRSINVCDPNHIISWKNGTLEQTYNPIIKPEERIEEGNKRALIEKIDQVIETMRDNTKAFCGDSPLVRIDLTAGLDTRVALAITKSLDSASNIRAYTTGAADSLDVSVARKIANLYGIEHEYDALQPPSPETFIEHARLLAFATNGDTNSKRALSPLPDLTDGLIPKIHGGGGEIFRGFYYPSLIDKPWLSSPEPDLVARYLESKFRNLEGLPWTGPYLPELLRQRLTEIVHGYSKVFPQFYDQLDLFYLYERFGRWGSMVPKATWVLQRFSPFDSPAAVRLAFTFPSPISTDCALHKTILKRYLPRTYHWFINEGVPIFLLGDTKFKIFAKKGISRAAGRLRKRLETWRHTQRSIGLEQHAAEIFAGSLGTLLRDTLLGTGSISTEILQKENLEKIIDDHITRRANNIQLLGVLVTIEQWRVLMQDTIRAALSS